MLVLSRKQGEILRIGDNIIVSVLGISGNQVRFGIDAPKEIPVHREEIYNKIHGVKPETTANVYQAKPQHSIYQRNGNKK